MLDKLTLADFTPHLHQSISIRFTSDVTLSAELVEANAWGEVPDNQRQPFNLIFRTPQKEHYPQAIYTLIHPVLGELSIFLVPLGPTAEGMRYEAVFN